MRYDQPRPGFELQSLILFPILINVTLSEKLSKIIESSVKPEEILRPVKYIDA